MENKIKIANIFVYPLKSCKEISLTEAKVTQNGILHDRTVAIFHADDLTPCTLRLYPNMSLIETNINDGIFVISIEGKEVFSFDPSELEGDSTELTIWGVKGSGLSISSQLDKTLSDHIGKSVVAFYSNTGSRRVLDDSKAQKFSTVTEADRSNFSDKCPFLITSKESLIKLNEEMEGKEPANMQQIRFRPNIVLESCFPFQELEIKGFKVGGVTFRPLYPCTRCKLTTVNYDDLTHYKSQEPLKTIKNLHYDETVMGGVFGMNYGVTIEGDDVIRVGDEIEILY